MSSPHSTDFRQVSKSASKEDFPLLKQFQDPLGGSSPSDQAHRKPIVPVSLKDQSSSEPSSSFNQSLSDRDDVLVSPEKNGKAVDDKDSSSAKGLTCLLPFKVFGYNSLNNRSFLKHASTFVFLKRGLFLFLEYNIYSYL
jgi:hypothetical protein